MALPLPRARIAAKVHASGLTIREYLWTHFTQVDATTGPLPTPTAPVADTPTPTTSPQPRPSASAAGGGSATATASATPAPTGTGLLGIDPLVFAALGVAVAGAGRDRLRRQAP